MNLPGQKFPKPTEWWPIDWGIFALIAGFKVLLHLIWINDYGYHRDELYFIQCARNLDWGYVDMAPLVPWITRLSGGLFDYSLAGLRIFSILAGVIGIFFTLRIVREWGGRRVALFTAGLAMVFAPVYLRTGKILHLPSFEYMIWTMAAFLVIKIIKSEGRRIGPWLLLGLVAGFGILNKHTMLLWGLGFTGGLLIGTLLGNYKGFLKSRGLWLAGATALIIVFPHLLWQVINDWPTLEFISNSNQGMLARIPRWAFILGQILYQNPLTLPLWVAGLAFFLTREGEAYQVLGWLFLIVFLFLVINQAKPYYLAPAYPVLYAGGAVFLETHYRKALIRLKIYNGVLLGGGLFFALITLPILSLPTTEKVIGGLLGFIVKPTDLTHDLRDEYGWREQALAVQKVFKLIRKRDQKNVTILAANYGQASAINFFGPALGLPTAISGHQTYYLWGYGRGTDVVIAYGYPEALLKKYFVHVKVVGKTFHPLGMEKENLPIYVCRKIRRKWDVFWPEFKRFYNGAIR